MFTFSACSLPPLNDVQSSKHLSTQNGFDTQLGKALEPMVKENHNLSGVVTLNQSLDAFTARMLLIAAAQKTIDVQYYIWRDDITGNMLLKALRDAAKRGVRVRMLVDDNGTAGLDSKLALLNSTQNAEVRLFNPFPLRTFKVLGFLTDFKRLNRRMHNKSLTVDGQVTVVGGRNIGDEYFGATQDVAFADLDVLSVGAIVDEVSHDFDLYWNSISAYPIDKLVTTPNQSAIDKLKKQETEFLDVPRAKDYIQVIKNSNFMDSILSRNLDFSWVKVRMVSDSPDKVLGKAEPKAMLLSGLSEIMGSPKTSIDLVSPYFVPTKDGVKSFAFLADQGVKVRILTNAMEATDVTAVHAGYMKYRKPLLNHGVELFEMRRNNALKKPKEKAGPFGSSGTSLHAKTFSVDRKRVFVGSFNFDPRSAVLNTELGFVIDSEILAQQISNAFDTSIHEHAYILKKDDKHGIVWIEQNKDVNKTLTSEPSVGLWKSIYLKFLSWMPIERLL